MSAPRKIWAAHPKLDRHFSARSFSDPDLPAHTYHHDDVVRELVEALEEIAGSADDGDGWTSDGHERCTEAAASALAKIAQEG